MLVFMWQIKIVTYQIARVDEYVAIILMFALDSLPLCTSQNEPRPPSTPHLPRDTGGDWV